MQWQGMCTLSEVREAQRGEEVQKCAGCWGGWFRGGAPAPNACMGMWRARGPVGSSVREQTDECPSFRLSPFACGPFEARSRRLAEAVAQCAYAERFFRVTSRRGDARADWCVSTDGGQGHAIGSCVRSMHIVDLGPLRQKYATVPQLNESHSVPGWPLNPMLLVGLKPL